MDLEYLTSAYKRLNPAASPAFIFINLERATKQTRLAAIYVLQNRANYTSEIVELAEEIVKQLGGEAAATPTTSTEAAATPTTSTEAAATPATSTEAAATPATSTEAATPAATPATSTEAAATPATSTEAATPAATPATSTEAATPAATPATSTEAATTPTTQGIGGKPRTEEVKHNISAGVRNSWLNSGVKEARRARNHVSVNGVQFRSVAAACTAKGIRNYYHIPLRRVLKQEGHLEVVMEDGSLQEWWLLSNVGTDIGARKRPAARLELRDVPRIARALSCATKDA